MMRTLSITATVLLSVSVVRSATAAPVDYLKQIKPLLKHRCVSCHGPLRQKGNLRVDAAVFLRKGGDSGAAVIPGKPGDSILLNALTGNGATKMPMEGKPLTPAQIAMIRQWIADGANAPKDEPFEKDPRDHWAFRSPVRPAVPQTGDGNPIDAFLTAKLREHKLTPQPAAAKHILLRRVYLDLIGLPPTPDELQAFLNDKSPDAFEKVVDRLLQSPRYGERWGRHWMDVWRYSDWYGYRAELRNSTRHIWRWRDYIVESLNKDRPYDEMIVDMLAADEHTPGDRDRLRATGFLARNYYKFNRDKWLDSTIEHTGKAFLGLTLNCARCHDHKYDPIEQTEYYEFRAIFEPHLIRTDRVPGQPDINKDGLSLVYDAKPDTKTYLYERGNDKTPDKAHPLTAAVPGFLTGKNRRFEIQPVKLPTELWYPGIRPHIRREMLAKAEAAVAAKEAALKKAEQQLAAAKAKHDKKLGIKKPVTVKKPEAKTPLIAIPFVVDDFKATNSKVWKIGAGKWTYRDGKLIQSDVAQTRQFIQTLAEHPRDFTAVLKFCTTGGGTYKSVGIAFDDDGRGTSDSVYLSAYAAGPKLQVVHTRAGKATYPRDAAKRFDVKIGALQELRLDLRDRLLNVTMNGKRQIVYTLPNDRRGGKLSLWTFDATAEFVHLDVKSLPANVELAGSVAQSSQQQSTKTVNSATLAEAAMKAVKADLTAARSALTSLKARIAADDARYATPPATSAVTLAATAAKLERQANLEASLAAVANAELEQRRGKPNGKTAAAIKKKLEAARKQLATAQSAIKKTESTYSPLTETYPATSTGRRLALAKWIASGNNPLTARVAVNHLWTRHFGTPLVSSTFDFGLNGKSPSHPELLDWLAVEFMDNGWSMKKLHRLIVTSQAYRRTSSARDASANNLQADADNRFYWRMNARRMEGEIVRDSVLSVASQLDLKMGGPELGENLGQTTYRRSLYYRHAPEKFMTFLTIFDAASTHECYRRNETVVPQQSLAMINSSLVLEQSRKLTALLNPQAKTDGDFVDRLFLRVLSRKPTVAERTACIEFLATQSKQLQQSKKLSTFVGGPNVKTPPSTDPQIRARESLAHVMLNHNEFITIR